MIVEKDVEIPMRDGVRLRADVFRPKGGGRFPAILNIGSYQKDKHWVPPPDLEEKDNPYMNWETVNPLWWVPRGYSAVRVDGPLARTRWTKFYLRPVKQSTHAGEPAEGVLVPAAPKTRSSLTYSASGMTKAGVASASWTSTALAGSLLRMGISFETAPFAEATEITGPVNLAPQAGPETLPALPPVSHAR